MEYNETPSKLHRNRLPFDAQSYNQQNHNWNTSCMLCFFIFCIFFLQASATSSSEPQLEETQRLIAVPVGRRWGDKGGGGWQVSELTKVLGPLLTSLLTWVLYSSVYSISDSLSSSPPSSTHLSSTPPSYPSSTRLSPTPPLSTPMSSTSLSSTCSASTLPSSTPLSSVPLSSGVLVLFQNRWKCFFHVLYLTRTATLLFLASENVLTSVNFKSLENKSPFSAKWQWGF